MLRVKLPRRPPVCAETHHAQREGTFLGRVGRPVGWYEVRKAEVTQLDGSEEADDDAAVCEVRACLAVVGEEFGAAVGAGGRRWSFPGFIATLTADVGSSSPSSWLLGNCC